MGTFADRRSVSLWHPFSILNYLLFVFPWKPCYVPAHFCHPLLRGFFSCLYVVLRLGCIHRENHSISHSCPSLSDPIFILNCLLDCSWVLSWQCHRTNHSHPKVSFSSGKSCMKGPYPRSISYVLHVILSSVHYWMLLTISVCIIIANPTISFQKSPYKH